MNSQPILADLPSPSPEALELSLELEERIKLEISEHGRMSFSRYMEKALYEPGYGYYMNNLTKFGAAGDFITAPEVSPLFARCIAKQCVEVLNEIAGASILELGAGSGVMAVNILRQLDAEKMLPERYYILELSGSLRQRQQQAIAELPEHIASRVEWLDSLSNFSLSGVVLANEVLDALPVDRFVIQSGEVKELVIGWSHDKSLFTCTPVSASSVLEASVRNIEQAVGDTFLDGYSSEINLQLVPWLQAVTKPLKQGAMLAIDYGYPRAEYYHPQRGMGTLLCHYKHRAHDHVLRWVGLQDITAQVDFTAVAEAAGQCGLEVAGFTHQAAFLIDCGIEQFMASQSDDAATQFEFAQQAKTLLLPTEMGERFKVMVLTKEYNNALLGFSSNNDRRHYL